MAFPENPDQYEEIVLAQIGQGDGGGLGEVSAQLQPYFDQLAREQAQAESLKKPPEQA